jgi:L-methionine (R)-S-oxide reductase
MADASLLIALAAAAQGPDREAAAKDIASLIRTQRSYRWVGIYEVNDHDIYVLGWSGPNAPAIPRFARSQGLCGRAIASRAIVAVDDVTKDPDYLTTFNSTRSEIVVPVLTTTMQAVGLIDVESEKVSVFDDEDRAALAACATAVRPLWMA